MIDSPSSLPDRQKIASIKAESDYMDIQEEIEDRYGNIPVEVYIKIANDL